MADKRQLYSGLLTDIKSRIQQAQVRAMLSVNPELVHLDWLYWDIGKLIHERQQQKGWGAGVMPKLANDLHNELPEVKGFSERNIKRMVAFYRAYEDPAVFVPRAVAQPPPERKGSPQLEITNCDFKLGRSPSCRTLHQNLNRKTNWLFKKNKRVKTNPQSVRAKDL